MKLWPSLHSKQDEDKDLVLILERGQVIGGIFDQKQNNLNISTNQELLPFVKEGEEGAQSFFSATLLALEHILLELRNSKEKIPARAHIFLPQSLYAVSIAHLVKEEKAPFSVTKDNIAEIINSDRAKRSLHLFKEENGVDSPAVTIEERLLSVRLNGYKIHNPYGKKARRISLTSMYSVSPQSVLEKINELLNRSFGKLKILYHPGIVSFSTSYFHTSPSVQNFAFLWPMRDQTEVTLIHNGRLGYVGVIPYGFGTAISQMATKRGTSEKETLDALMTQSSSLLIEPAYSNFKEVFTQTLLSASPETYLPQYFVFPGGSQASTTLASWLLRNDFWQLSDRFRSLLKSPNGKEAPSVYISQLSQEPKNRSFSTQNDILILAGDFVKETGEI